MVFLCDQMSFSNTTGEVLNSRITNKGHKNASNGAPNRP